MSARSPSSSLLRSIPRPIAYQPSLRFPLLRPTVVSRFSLRCRWPWEPCPLSKPRVFETKSLRYPWTGHYHGSFWALPGFLVSQYACTHCFPAPPTPIVTCPISPLPVPPSDKMTSWAVEIIPFSGLNYIAYMLTYLRIDLVLPLPPQGWLPTRRAQLWLGGIPLADLAHFCQVHIPFRPRAQDLPGRTIMWV